MTFIWPWSLIGLIAVGALALWLMFRQSPMPIVVSSLSLWQKALEGVGKSARRRIHRRHAEWFCLLAGAVAAVLALSRPVYRGAVPIRRVTLAIYPSAELAGDGGMESLGESAGKLLERLDDNDRVQILLPAMLGGGGGWMNREQAREKIGRLRPLPVSSADMIIPEPSGDSQHTYHFIPAGANIPAGGDFANTTAIELPARLAAVTLDAIGATDVVGRKMQIFVAAVNNRSTQWKGTMVARGYFASKAGSVEYPPKPLTIPPRGRKSIVLIVPRSDAIAVKFFDDSGLITGMGASGYLARSSEVIIKVAIIGPDQPLIRRLVRINPMLEQVGDVNDADVVIANQADPPGTKPSLVINPPSNPPSWRRADQIGAICLDRARWDKDDPIMSCVDLSTVAVRKVKPWVFAGAGIDKNRLKVIVSYSPDSLILRNNPQASSGIARRVFVAFDVRPSNTNFSATDAFVIFISNAIRWLGGAGANGPTGYGYLRASQVGDISRWIRIDSPTGGIYKNPDTAKLEAVTLAGLKSRDVGKSPVSAAASAYLPERKSTDQPAQTWPILVIIAMAFWLVGWGLRIL